MPVEYNTAPGFTTKQLLPKAQWAALEALRLQRVSNALFEEYKRRIIPPEEKEAELVGRRTPDTRG